MRKVWNTILAPLMIFVGTLIAPNYIVVTDKLSYLWIFLLQIPVTIVTILIVLGLVMLIAKLMWRTQSIALIILLAACTFVFGSAVGILGFYLMDLILPGLTITSVWAYVLLGLVYGILSVEVKTKSSDD